MVQLVGDEDLRHLDGRRLEEVCQQLLGGIVARLVERGVRELAADGLVEVGDRRDTDGLGEVVVERRQDLLGDLGDLRRERAGLAPKVLVRVVIRERELERLRVARAAPDERVGQSGDRVVATELEVRVATHRGHLLPVEGHIEIDREHVIVLGGALDGLDLGVMLAHPGDRLLDLLVGDGRRLHGHGGGGRVAERDVWPHRHGGRVLERLPRLELAHLDLGAIEPIDVLEIRDLLERLVDDVSGGVLPEMLGAVRAFVEGPRRLARAEARDLRVLHVLLERALAGTLEAIGVDFDVQRDDRPGLALHGVAERARGGGRHRVGLGRGRRSRARPHGGRLLCAHGRVKFTALRPMLANALMYFYEIHEPDDDLGTAVLVAHEDRFSPEEFFRMVKRARDLVKDGFEEASLPEAIANELERSSRFVHVTDERLLASVSVGETDQDTFLVASEEGVRTVYVEGDAPKGNGDRPN